MSVQLTPVERKQRKRLTDPQKLEILREWEATGNGVAVAEIHGIHPMNPVSVQKASGPGGSRVHQGHSARVDPRMRELEWENQKLRDTVTLLSQELVALKKKMNVVSTGEYPDNGIPAHRESGSSGRWRHFEPKQCQSLGS